MAKVKGKGSIFKMTIASTLTPVAQLIEFGVDGSGADTYKSTTLDNSDAFHTYEVTGYSEGGTFSASMFYDPALAGHQFITDQITTPASNACQITYADTGATTQSLTATGWQFGSKVVMDDGLKADVSAQITGSTGWPT